MGDQSRDPGAFALDQGVGSQGGGITDRVDLTQGRIAIHPGLLAGTIQGLVEPERQVVVGGQCLGLDIEIVPNEETIAEGAADVNGDAFHCLLYTSDAADEEDSVD